MENVHHHHHNRRNHGDKYSCQSNIWFQYYNKSHYFFPENLEFSKIGLDEILISLISLMNLGKHEISVVRIFLKNFGLQIILNEIFSLEFENFQIAFWI